MEPDIPADIPALFSFLAVNGHKGLPHIAVKALIKRFSLALSSIYFHLFEAAVFIQGNAAMVEKVSVIYLIQISLGQQETHMLLQLFTVPERINKTFHDKLLFCRQPVRVLRVHGGEMAVQHLIYRAIQTDAATPIIHQMKQVPVFQLEFGMLLCQLPLHLKLYDGDGLVHLDVQFSFAGTACIGPFERETGAGVVPVHVQ